MKAFSWHPFFLGLALASPLQAQIAFDFETAGQWTDNFRKITASAVINADQSSNGGANDFVRSDNTSSTTISAVYAYDTTPGDAASGTQSAFSTADPITVSMDFRATAAASSVGIFFVNPNNDANNVLVLFTLDSSGNDTFRAFRNGVLSTGNAGTQIGSTQNFSPSVGTIGTTFIPLSFGLSLSGSTPTLSITAGSQTLSQVGISGDFNFTDAVIAIRMFDATVTVNPATPLDIDNLQIAAVPEPSTWALLGLGALGGAALRRSSRRMVGS